MLPSVQPDNRLAYTANRASKHHHHLVNLIVSVPTAVSTRNR